MIDYLNDLFGQYYPIISTVFGILATLFTVIRIYSKFSDWLHKREQRLIDIEKRLHHLDNSEDGRVNKLSKLVESQIDSNKKAFALASYVKGKQEASS